MELLFVVCVGAVFGSFANVLIYRIPHNLSIIKPNSFCPMCQISLKWSDKIPIFSFLFCRGHCRYCRAKIPNFYFVSEIFGVVLAVFCYEFLGEMGIIFFLFILVFYALSVIDIYFLAIPDVLNFLNLFLCILFAGFFYDSLLNVCISAFCFMGFASFLRLFVGSLSHKEVLGEGDIIVFGVLGAGLSVFYAAIALLLSALLALVFLLWRSFRGKKQEIIPFVPFLMLGFLSAFVMQIL